MNIQIPKLLGFVMDLKTSFGNIFLLARKAAGLVQDDFEPTTSRSYVSYIERGKVSITLDKLHELSNLMSIHPVSLIFKTYLTYDEEVSALDLMSRIMEDMKKLEKQSLHTKE